MADIVSDSKPEEDEESPMDSLPKALENSTRLVKPLLSNAVSKGHHQTTLLCAGIVATEPLPAVKEDKQGPPDIDLTQNDSPIAATAGNATAGSTQPPNLQYNADGFVIESVKKRSEYTMKDLPVPSDQRWSRGVIGTLTLWCGSQPNEVFVAALQDIFNNVYPGIKYRALQCISEWRSGFGSAALALMISYFAELPDDKVSQDEAAKLHRSFRFLDANPNSDAEPTPDGRFKSPFLYELLATIHLSNISGYIEVKGWNTKQLGLGKNGGGVIAIAAAALERAVEFIRDGVIDIEQVLVDMIDAPDGKMKVKLPKTLNKATGQETLTPYQFSASNWSAGTANYKLSVKRRGPEFVRSVFAEAQSRRNLKIANTAEGDCTAASKNANDADPCALLCNDPYAIEADPKLMQILVPGCDLHLAFKSSYCSSPPPSFLPCNHLVKCYGR
ncbi:hypothetical protein JVT61DRAFT_3773 [Boletus reticuloceps]|uniref:Uncharacterized protein n=1 Tax=Boletus reticuloceps TaxID=495285 RepID=A0A8I2YQ18_9AGAM|nr:hypothetical protein JVT61DRAFT_3773 [Boletus reticuloceps]